MAQSNIDERNTDLSEEEVRKLIKLKLEKKIAQLPYGFWRCENGKEHSRIAIKYLIEEHLELEIQEIPNKITAKTFHDAGLFRILVEFFDSSYFKAIDYTYPDFFQPWQFQKGMTGIWNGTEGKRRSLEAINYIITELKLTDEEIPKKITYQVFKDFGLGGMLQTLYNSSPYLAIESLFPGKYKAWEFSVKNFWKHQSKEKAKEAVIWLIEHKLGLTEDNLIAVRRKHFLEYNLGQMLKQFYQNSHLNALRDVYKF